MFGTRKRCKNREGGKRGSGGERATITINRSTDPVPQGSALGIHGDEITGKAKRLKHYTSKEKENKHFGMQGGGKDRRGVGLGPNYYSHGN